MNRGPINKAATKTPGQEGGHPGIKRVVNAKPSRYSGGHGHRAVGRPRAAAGMFHGFAAARQTMRQKKAG